MTNVAAKKFVLPVNHALHIVPGSDAVFWDNGLSRRAEPEGKQGFWFVLVGDASAKQRAGITDVAKDLLQRLTQRLEGADIKVNVVHDVVEACATYGLRIPFREEYPIPIWVKDATMYVLAPQPKKLTL